MRSDFFKINFRDIAKGFLTSVIVAVLTYFYEVVQTGDFTAIDWKTVGFTALTAGIGYLFKNLITNSNGEVAKTEQP